MPPGAPRLSSTRFVVSMGILAEDVRTLKDALSKAADAALRGNMDAVIEQLTRAKTASLKLDHVIGLFRDGNYGEAFNILGADWQKR